MIVVIQCAASKHPHAGRMRTASGTSVEFVADPESTPPAPGVIHARPDELAGERSWRQLLTEYNSQPANNPLGLLPAYKLYENDAYCRLADRFGLASLFILSAGWGLLSSEFLTPYYDITFTASADPWKRRRKWQHYDDFCMLPEGAIDHVVFLGGKDYLPLFCTLTSSVRALKTVFYNSSKCPSAAGYSFKRFETTTRTNWQYECAAALVAGTIGVV